MTDRLSKEQRSYNMSQIRSKFTKPELKLKKTLGIMGFKYQPLSIYGKPDFANKKAKVAVFIDGCFWHSCPKHFNYPKTNRDFWVKKIKNNILRDKIVNRRLSAEGWRVIRIWEHSLSAIKN